MSPYYILLMPNFAVSIKKTVARPIEKMSIISKYRLTIAGLILGAAAGFLYYHYIGCASGTCLITSRPLNSSLYGAMMGGLLANSFQKEKTKTERS